MPSSKKPELLKRRDAVQETVDKFRGQSFKLGTFDCAKMVQFYLRRRGLGKLIPTAKVGEYATPLGARAALRRLGVSNIPELMDKHFPRHPSALFALPGDLIEMPAAEDDHGIGALAVYVGNGIVLAYHEDGAAELCRVLEPLGAWKVG